MSKLRLTLLGACLCLAPYGAMAQGAAKLTDPQIAHIAYTAGQIDIQAAELALKQSKNKEVRAFADDMVRDHKAVNEKALALVKKLNVKPECRFRFYPARDSELKPATIAINLRPPFRDKSGHHSDHCPARG